MAYIYSQKTKESVRAALAYPHSIIYLGAKGSGMMDLARETAKVFLCRKDLDTPDYEELSVEENIKKEMVDELISSAMLKPSFAERRVFVIYNAETMTPSAQNALLKTLEDGADDNVFLFVAHRKLLDTIHSRSETVEVTKPPIEELSGVDEELYEAVSSVGQYQRLIEDTELCSFAKGIPNAMSDRKALFSYFGMLKEKDKNSFFDSADEEKKEIVLKFMLGGTESVMISKMTGGLKKPMPSFLPLSERNLAELKEIEAAAGDTLRKLQDRSLNASQFMEFLMNVTRKGGNR